MKEAVLFLGVGYLQRHSIKSAKNAGFIILGVDINSRANSASICDYFLHSDSTDAAAIYDWCCSLKDCKIIAVWANNDILIPARASLESALEIKFPHASHRVCFDLLSKVRSSEILSDTGFVPNQYEFNQNIQKDLDYPVIVKPKKGSGSQGVKLVASGAEFEKIKFNPEKQVIEEYIEGIEFGTNHFYDGEKIVRLPAVQRYFDHDTTMVPLGTVIADMDDEMLKSSYTGLEEIIVKNKWFGPIKSDIFIDRGQFNIIEMSPRFHGEIDTSFVFNYFGISLSDMYFSALTNNRLDSWKYLVEQSEKFVAGYISVYNDKVLSKNAFLVTTLEKYNLKYLDVFVSNSKPAKKSNSYPESTADLVGFVFYSSKERLSSQDFKSLFIDINL
jgi:predicted ATP-grasp superfamily ATP-dependent carboligase